MAGKGKGRSAVERAMDRRAIAELYLNGKKTQAEIAAELRLGQATVSRELAAITREVDSERRQIVDYWREVTLAKLQWVQDQAEEGWEASRRRAVTPRGIVEVPLVSDSKGKLTEKYLLPGDRGFLDVYGESAMRMWKVLGYEKLTVGTENDQEVNIQITVAPVAPRPKPGGNGQSSAA